MPDARRRPSRRALAGAIVLAAAAAACGKEERVAIDSTPSAATTMASASEAAGAEPRKPACPKTGHWSDCQVRERLVRSGLAPHDTSRDELPSLGPRPTVLRLGRGALAVYLFADSTARVRAAATLDTVKYVRGGGGPTMRSQATAIENDNLLALLFSKNEQQIERVSDALTAGAPQP